jgi:hypothetical protein
MISDLAATDRIGGSHLDGVVVRTVRHRRARTGSPNVSVFPHFRHVFTNGRSSGSLLTQ